MVVINSTHFAGGQTRSPTFGSIDSEQSTFGGKRGGSRVTSYTGTAEVDGAGRLVSISAMHVHKDKCHEELKWEDYKLGDKGMLKFLCLACTFGQLIYNMSYQLFGYQWEVVKTVYIAGTQVRISTFDGIGSGQSALGGQYGGSKVVKYTGTLEVNGGSSAGSLLSLSAMPVYQNRSHEELRWEDYQFKNRGMCAWLFCVTITIWYQKMYWLALRWLILICRWIWSWSCLCTVKSF